MYVLSHKFPHKIDGNCNQIICNQNNDVTVSNDNVKNNCLT